MKKEIKIKIARALSAGLACAVLFGAAPANAAYEDYGDTAGHWAETSLRGGYDDGYINGFEDMTMRPDDPITDAQIVTLLCRVLGADRGSGDEFQLPGNTWYKSSAEYAAYLGFLDAGSGIYDLPMTRADALTMFGRAFCLTGAQPDDAALDGFYDTSWLTGEQRDAVSRLVSMGLVEGFDGYLRGEEYITRAEFITLLYRVLDKVQVFGCKQRGCSIRAADGDTAVVHGYEPGSIRIESGKMKRVSAAVSGGMTYVTIYGGASVEEMDIERRGGKVEILGNAETVNVLGSGKTVWILDGCGSVYVCGEGNTVIIDSGASIGSVVLAGEDNHLTVYGSVTALRVEGKNSTADGWGYVSNAELCTLDCTVSVKCARTNDTADHGIEGASLAISMPETITAGEKLTACAEASGLPDGEQYELHWSIGGEEIGTDVISADEPASLNRRLRLTECAEQKLTLTAEIVYTTQQGVVQRVSADAQAELVGFDEEYFSTGYAQEVIGLVSCEYQGDYTLEWALENDYEAYDKETWVNAKGFESKGGYLVWVNLACQRVNVFTGSAGQWKLIHTFLGCSGAPETPTPVGVWKLTYKNQAGWNMGTYTVQPVVGFKGGGYAFHSRLYAPNSDQLVDGSMGFPASHGCIRMYDEDVQWIFDNVPVGATVVVF